MRARVFNVMQYEKHPRTGEPLLDEATIVKALAHKSIKEWAYIRHDMDVYSAKDEEDDPDRKQGEKKPPHWHIVMKCENAIEVSVIAKWLRIPENFVDVPKGSGAFLDCVQYLTHEADKQQELGKTHYDDSKVNANFDFRQALDERAENRLKYGRDLCVRDRLRHNVLYDGWTLKQAEKLDEIAYMNDFEKLKKCRIEYLQNRAPLPPLRINYYIEGQGGVGKNAASRALAKALYPDLSDDECYFELGGTNVSFEGYDGQPVVVWNDYRADSLIYRFGRGEVFDIFDSHPTTAKHNVKYGSVKLINAVNIVNGIEPYQEFLDALAGEYSKDGNSYKAEDKGQAYRRFPIILCLRESDFDVLLNKGVAEGTQEYLQYLSYKTLVGNFGVVARRLEGMAKETVLVDMTKPPLDCANIVKEKEQGRISDPALLPDDLKDYGKPDFPFE